MDSAYDLSPGTARRARTIFLFLIRVHSWAAILIFVFSIYSGSFRGEFF
jgi:hypothetical protein